MLPFQLDPEARWALSHKKVIPVQRGEETQTASVQALTNCSYDFRVRAMNAMGAWSDWGEASLPIFLGAPAGDRPAKRPVRGLHLQHTGGGYIAITSEIRRYINENVQADKDYDQFMIKWLRDQGWAALRAWCHRCAKLTPAQRAAEALRLKSTSRLDDEGAGVSVWLVSL